MPTREEQEKTIRTANQVMENLFRSYGLSSPQRVRDFYAANRPPAPDTADERASLLQVIAEARAKRGEK